VLENLADDLRKKIPDGPVLLCFTCDPYQPLEETAHLTRSAIALLAAAGAKIRVLTKAPSRALRLDGDLLKRAGVDFGVTLAWFHDERRVLWEPNAESVAERLDALSAAKKLGLKTWVSMEPVIEPKEALDLLDYVLPKSIVNHWSIGRLNHDARANEINWSDFLIRALIKLKAVGVSYLIKDALWRESSRAGLCQHDKERK
jgi:hypothetical protein